MDQTSHMRSSVIIPGGTILIADGNRTVARVIAKILEKEHHKVHQVEDGPAALDALLNQPLTLALIDADLPKMNAIEVTHLYRFGSVGRAHLPILGLIGETSGEMLSACIDAGLDGCISKPIEPTELLDAVNTSLGIVAEPAAAAETPVGFDDVTEWPAIDPRILRDLEKLGGEGFIEDVISQFVADASRLFPDLSASASACDAGLFHDHIHALRSCAGNVGATGLYKMCLAWRAIGARELASNGSECISKLQAEFARATSALDSYEWRQQQAS